MGQPSRPHLDESGMGEVQITAGRWLNLARAAWLVLALATVLLFAAGVLVYYRQLQDVCTAAPCNNSPTLAEARALAAIGVSVDFAARYFVILDVLTALVFGAVALAIFCRRSDDRMALYLALTLLTFGTFGIQNQSKIAGILTQIPPIWHVPVYILAFLGGAAITIF